MRVRSSVKSGVPISGGLVARLTGERETGGFVARMCASKRLKTVRRKLFLHYARSLATHRIAPTAQMTYMEADVSISIVCRWASSRRPRSCNDF
jgi:hypothetical protein